VPSVLHLLERGHNHSVLPVDFDRW
jgi:hypothetical protein